MRGIANSLNISRSEILRKKRRRKGTEDETRTQNAPSPLQKRCKDYKKRDPEEIFKEYGFWHHFNAILRNSWISSAMAMAMSIYRTLCVLVFLKISLLEMRIAFGNVLS